MDIHQLTAPFVIAEIAQTHDGSLGQAHAFIDAVADAGADAIKFQTHIADAESTPDEPWRVKFSRQDNSRYEYWQRMEFTAKQWAGLSQHAAENELIFLSSAFSLEAVELLNNLEMFAWKVASGEVSNHPLLEAMCGTGRPILLSSGMSSLQELDNAAEIVRTYGNDLAVFQCTSAYPCPPEKIGINLIQEFQDRYQCPVGLSDHSGTIFPSLSAVTLGAMFVEVHVTMSRYMFGPDVPASVTLEELKQLVQGVQFTHQMAQHPLDKDKMAVEMQPLRDLFNKSIVVREDLPSGTRLEAHHLTVKKPGTGISATDIQQVIGQTLQRDMSANTRLSWDDLATS